MRTGDEQDCFCNQDMEVFKRNNEDVGRGQLYMDTDSEISDVLSDVLSDCGLSTKSTTSNVSKNEIKVELIRDSSRGRGGGQKRGRERKRGQKGRFNNFVNHFFPVQNRNKEEEMQVEEEYMRASDYAHTRHQQVMNEAKIANRNAQVNEMRQTYKINNAVKLAKRTSIIEKIENTRMVRESVDLVFDEGRGSIVPTPTVDNRRSLSPKYRGGGALAETLLASR